MHADYRVAPDTVSGPGGNPAFFISCHIFPRPDLAAGYKEGFMQIFETQ